MEAQHKAKLVDAGASAFADRGVTTTVSRTEIEETLRSAEGPAMLVLDIARVRNGGREDVEAHTIEVQLETTDLEELLRTTSGDAIALRFDQTELEQALDESDVDAHGLRQKALILSVAAATAAGVAGQADGMRAIDQSGAPAATLVASAPISDVVSGGPAGQAAEQAALVTDVVSGGPAGQSAEQLAVSGGPEWPRAAAASADETTLASDVVSGGPAGQTAAETPLVSDVVSGGPAPVQAAAETPLVSDVVSGGPATTVSATAEPAGGGGGISISSSEALEAGLASGLALLITGASFAALRQRRPVRPA